MSTVEAEVEEGSTRCTARVLVVLLREGVEVMVVLMATGGVGREEEEE